MRARRFLACSAAILLAVAQSVSTQSTAAAANYTYTVIDNDSNCTHGNAVIGNNGEVAFFAVCNGTGRVRKGDGTTTTPIYTPGSGQPYSVADSVVSINDLGDVAFTGGSTGYSILVGNGGPLTVVADTSVQTQWTTVLRPSINNSGEVAFMAQKAGTPSFNTVILAESGGFYDDCRAWGPGARRRHDSPSV